MMSTKNIIWLKKRRRICFVPQKAGQPWGFSFSKTGHIRRF
ncbi:hypothetical protein DESPIG_00949 [Desulfovibrio piger ATCC 29098]|uniref:Uncharacterized protein n=1 Tax=Desulfovibrio piger ATCC 29098 TaxID=411464 RepID=B6WSA0_9BACT|nr:hypothetical protein DESPIG_00949 [Desulfovibrio piger ATCC 29098]